MNGWQRPFDREKVVRETRNRAHVVFGLWPSLVQKAHAGLQPARETAMTFKNATRALVTLAKGNPEFRKALRGEMARGANININIRDFAIDEFSQHQMLRNLQEGDLIEILFEPNELHPRRVVTRLVASDFEPTIPGVLLRGAGEAEEILADRGQGMPLVWEPGAGEPAAPVIEIKIIHSKLAAEKSKKAATQDILETLGGREKLASMVGARDIQVRGDHVTFRWPNRVASKGTRCMVAKKGDKYSLGFGAKNASGEWEIVGMYHVAKEELVSTFEKHTGWFLRL